MYWHPVDLYLTYNNFDANVIFVICMHVLVTDAYRQL